MKQQVISLNRLGFTLSWVFTLNKHKGLTQMQGQVQFAVHIMKYWKQVIAALK